MSNGTNDEEYYIDEGVAEEIENYAGMGGAGLNESDLDSRSLAYLTTQESGIRDFFADLGITNPTQYTKFAETYDPTREHMKHYQFGIGKEKQYRGFTEQIKDELKPAQLDQESIQARSNIEGIGGVEYEDTLRDLNVGDKVKGYMSDINLMKLDRDDAIKMLHEDHTRALYGTAGDIYQQQQNRIAAAQSGRGGKK